VNNQLELGFQDKNGDDFVVYLTVLATGSAKPFTAANIQSGTHYQLGLPGWENAVWIGNGPDAPDKRFGWAAVPITLVSVWDTVYDQWGEPHHLVRFHGGGSSLDEPFVSDQKLTETEGCVRGTNFNAWVTAEFSLHAGGRVPLWIWGNDNPWLQKVTAP